MRSFVPAVRRSLPLLTLLLALASSLVAGCYRRTGSYSRQEPIYIDVTNHNSLDVNVYAVHSGMRIRLGTVTTASTEHFTLKAGQFGTNSFQLLADPIGSSRTFLSEVVDPAPGQIVEWTLEAVLVQSVLVIRDTT